MKSGKIALCLSVLTLLSLLCLSACGEEKKDQQPAPAGAPARTSATEPGSDAPAAKPEAAASSGEDRAAAMEPAPGQKPAEAEERTMKENSGPDSPLTEKDLLHRRFELQAINGTPYAFKEKRPSLEFNEGFQLSGAVCNAFMGKADLGNGVLSAQNMAATRKLCFEEEINSLEADFFSLLHNGAAVAFDGRRLTLRGKGREADITLEYEIRDWVR